MAISTNKPFGMIVLFWGFTFVFFLWNQLRYSTHCFLDYAENTILYNNNNSNNDNNNQNNDPLSSSVELTTITRTDNHYSLNKDDPRRTNNEIIGMESWIPLEDLVNTEVESECPEGLFLVTDNWVHSPNNVYHNNNESNSNGGIPRIIHVTSKTRCMPRPFIDNLEKWKNITNYSFVFHNDAAMDRLMQYASSNHNHLFPMLQHVIHCAINPTIKADIWRGIVLYIYGGIYTDIDNAPAEQFFSSRYRPYGSTSLDDDHDPNIIIQRSDQSFFVVERGGFLSQYFMASIPHHPLMWLLVQHCITRLLATTDIEHMYVPYVTGPGALKTAFIQFMVQISLYDVTDSNNTIPYSQVYAGVYTSPFYGPNATVTVAGKKYKKANDIIARESVSRKKRLFEQMNMTDYRAYPITNVTPIQTCIERIYHKTRQIKTYS